MFTVSMFLWTVSLFPLFLMSTEGSDCHGASDGTIVNRGRYWYECSLGRLIERGCLSPSNERIPLEGTFDTGGYRMKCIRDGDGYLAFDFKSCLHQGQEYGVNEEWEEPKYYFKCIRSGDHLEMQVAGCIDQGRRVSIDQRVSRGSFVFQCKMSQNGTCSMCPVACMVDGREYQLGDTFERGEFWFTCKKDEKNSRKMLVQPSGCLGNGQRYRSQERFHKADTIYECFVSYGEARTRGVGCVENGVERKFRDQWYVGEGQFKYTVICDQNERDQTAMKIYVRCRYQDRYSIEPGCYQIVENQVIGCLKSGAQLNMQAVRVDDIGQFASKGLRLC